MSESTGTIDTCWEKVDHFLVEEIVSTYGNIGLYVGEMDSDELATCLLDPNNRVIYQLTVDDIDKTNKLFNDLYGKAVEPRVKYILKHSEEARVD